MRMSRIASLKSGIGRNGSGHSGHSVKQPIMQKSDNIFGCKSYRIHQVTRFWYEDGHRLVHPVSGEDQLLRQNRPSEPWSLQQAWSVHGEVCRYDLLGETMGQICHIYITFTEVFPSVLILRTLELLSWATKPGFLAGLQLNGGLGDYNCSCWTLGTIQWTVHSRWHSMNPCRVRLVSPSR